jgi:DedD protein
MAASQDTEITLGTGKLLVLFFGLVGICAAFFAVGYSLGRKAEPPITTANAATQAQPTSIKTKAPANGPAQAPMTFYKNVEQKDPNSELTPAPAAKSDNSSTAANNPSAEGHPATATPPADSTTTLPVAASYFVQVAAVSKQEDADALVDALKKKEYPAFVAASPTTDKLFRIQVGPFTDVKEAEAMRTRLVNDGYNPILKK